MTSARTAECIWSCCPETEWSHFLDAHLLTPHTPIIVIYFSLWSARMQGGCNQRGQTANGSVTFWLPNALRPIWELSLLRIANRWSPPTPPPLPSVFYKGELHGDKMNVCLRVYSRRNCFFFFSISAAHQQSCCYERLCNLVFVRQCCKRIQNRTIVLFLLVIFNARWLSRRANKCRWETVCAWKRRRNPIFFQSEPDEWLTTFLCWKKNGLFGGLWYLLRRHVSARDPSLRVL